MVLAPGRYAPRIDPKSDSRLVKLVSGLSEKDMKVSSKKAIAFLLFGMSFFSYCVGHSSISPEDDSKSDLYDLLSLSQTGSACSGYSSFWIRNLVSNTSVCTETRLMYSGTQVNVFAGPGVENAIDYEYVGKEFDTKIHPRLGEAFGYSEDIDNDGKVAIVVVDIIDGSAAGGSFVSGFFDPVDYFPDSSSYSVHSNYANIIYMDGVQLIELRKTDLAAGKPDPFLATLAHEYQHLIRFQFEAKVLISGGDRDEAWINEGTSEVAADIAGYSPQISRINCYRGRNSNACARGVNGATVFGSSRFNTLVDYAFAYSFMKYAYMISGNDTGSRNTFFKLGIQGPNGYRASDAVGLFQLFRSNAQGYTAAPQEIKTILGTSPNSTFRKIFPAFVWLSLGDSVPDYGQAGSDASGSSTFLQDFQKVLAYYSFPPENSEGGELRKLYSPLRVPEISPLSQLAPGQIQLVKADRTNSNATSNLLLFKKVWDGAQYSLQINSDARRSGDISVSLGLTEAEEADEGGEPIVLPESSEPKGICPHGFIKLSRKRIKMDRFSIF